MPQQGELQMRPELAAHNLLAWSFRWVHALTSCYVTFSHMSPCDCFSSALIFLSVGSRLPLDPWLGCCHAKLFALTATHALTAAATARNSQAPATHKQLQLPLSGPCTDHTLCPGMWHSSSRSHTLLSSSACLVRHLRILKRRIMFFFLVSFSPC